MAPAPPSRPIPKKLSRVLRVHELKDQARPIHGDDLEKEFRSIPLHKPDPSTQPPNTTPLNRYSNILPNPKTRVMLTKLPENDTSDYINANWVRGYDGQPRRFIAAQGPKENTISDFWRMVWEYSVEAIVMTTGMFEGGRRKCDRYWPDEDESVTHGKITIHSDDAMDCGDYIITPLTIRHEGMPEDRKVKHFWYTGWPDHGVPDKSGPVLEYLRSIREATEQSTAPILVHCSAGIGRTGTFMAIDIGMQELQSKWRVVDVLSIVSKMREDRGQSVQTGMQYCFIYKALADYVTPGRPNSMFGNEVARNVEVEKGPEGFGFVLRGSYPSFIVEMDENGPGFRAGLRLGDHLLAINGVPAEGAQRDVVAQIRESGNKVLLTVLSKTPY